MPYIPPEVIEQARQIDLLTYLQNCEPHELVRISGNNYTTRTHDSLKISNGKWMWWSQRIGGYNALDYLVKVRGFSFVEAVETLMGKAAVMPTLTVRPKQEEKPKTLLLPEKSKTTDKIREYLFGRGIDAAITDECIKKGVIFESLPYHNIVFVGFDEKQKPKYAAFRATNSRRILGDCSGSDKHYSFRLADSASSEVRLTNMIKSGKELKVFSFQQKDLPKFTEQAKRYGVLYCVLRDKNTKSDTAMVDIIARAEDAAKIQRISDRFELGKVDKASIVSEAEKDVADREAAANEVPTKSRGEIIVEEAMGKPMQKEGNSHQNPSVAKTDKSPLSERDLETTGTHTDKGVAKAADKKPSVKEKLDRYKAAAKAEKEAERTVPEASKEKPKTPEANRQTVHRQPKKSKKSKER